MTIQCHSSQFFQSNSLISDVMVLNDILEQATGRQSRASDHGGKYWVLWRCVYQPMPPKTTSPKIPPHTHITNNSKPVYRLIAIFIFSQFFCVSLFYSSLLYSFFFINVVVLDQNAPLSFLTFIYLTIHTYLLTSYFQSLFRKIIISRYLSFWYSGKCHLKSQRSNSNDLSIYIYIGFCTFFLFVSWKDFFRLNFWQCFLLCGCLCTLRMWAEYRCGWN